MRTHNKELSFLYEQVGASDLNEHSARVNVHIEIKNTGNLFKFGNVRSTGSKKKNRFLIFQK